MNFLLPTASWFVFNISIYLAHGKLSNASALGICFTPSIPTPPCALCFAATKGKVVFFFYPFATFPFVSSPLLPCLGAPAKPTGSNGWCCSFLFSSRCLVRNNEWFYRQSTTNS